MATCKEYITIEELRADPCMGFDVKDDAGAYVIPDTVLEALINKATIISLNYHQGKTLVPRFRLH